MGDGSGKYMMKSDGFYCLDMNGASTEAEIHYFQDYEISELYLTDIIIRVQMGNSKPAVLIWSI